MDKDQQTTELARSPEVTIGQEEEEHDFIPKDPHDHHQKALRRLSWEEIMEMLISM